MSSEQYILLAKGTRGLGLCNLIVQATGDKNLFAFSELLSLSSITELANGPQPEFSAHHNLLRLFSYGTLSDFKSASASLPSLSPVHVNKLKQLTLMSIAAIDKSIAYDLLMSQLDIPTLRDLEHFIITECFYTGLVNGKLDQKKKSLEVFDVVGRDVLPEELKSISRGLGEWLATSSGLLVSIESKISELRAGQEASKASKAALELKRGEARKAAKAEEETRAAAGGGGIGDDAMYLGGGVGGDYPREGGGGPAHGADEDDYMEEDDQVGGGGGGGGQMEGARRMGGGDRRMGGRPKMTRRR